MSKEIYISTTPHETRLAIVEDEQLAEIYYERENEYTLAGSIYNGKVTRVLPGMQSAFVDVGLERDAFLYVTDFMEEQGDSAEFESDSGGSRRPAPQPMRDSSEDRPSTDRRGFGRNGDRQPRREPPVAAAAPAVDLGETISFDEPIAPHPTDDLATDADGQGSRRWRGRRGRRRGRSAPREGGHPASSAEPAPEANDFPTTPELPEGDEPQHLPLIEASAAEERSGSAVIEIDLGSELPAPSRKERDGSRGRDRNRNDRGRGRRDDQSARPPADYGYGQEEEAPAPSGPPILLPGESIRKYRDPAEVAAEDAARQASAPRTEVLQAAASSIEITGWDGGVTLPGETLSRHRGRSTRPETAATSHNPTKSVPLTREPDLTAYTPPAFSAAQGSRTQEEERSVIAAVDEPGAPTPIADTDAIAAAAVPEETGGLTQTPALAGHRPATNHETDLAPATAVEYEPTDGQSVSVDARPGPNYLRLEQEEPQIVAQGHSINASYQDLQVQEVTAEFPHAEHDATTYDLDGSADPVAPVAEEAEPAMHDLTTLAPTGEMVSESFFPSMPASQDEPNPANPVLTEFAVQSSESTELENAPDFLVAEPNEQTLPELHAYGDGELLEEEIDGDEYEFEAALSSLDDMEVEEYEEETLDGTEDLGGVLQEMVMDDHATAPSDVEGDNEPTYVTSNGGFTVDDFGGEPEDDEDVPEQPAQSGADGRTRRDQQPRRGSRDRRPGQRGNDRGRGRKSMQTTDLPAINDLLKPGQEILVQIAKEPIAKKGARITSHIALPGRFLVFMPTVNHTGVSRKISSEEERRRLKSILLSEKGDAQGGFIVRTAADGASEEELRNDLRFLIHLWDDIKTRSEGSKSPALIYHDLNLIERILRDQVTDNFSAIWVDTEAEYERVLRFLQRFQPSLVRRVKLYTKETPLFEHFGVTQEIEKALKSKVWLKSGGSIVINQTEALVAIDINTGKYVGKTARLEDTILKTNLDSIPEIVRQIRLRDLGGIIVIDFIDMDERKNRAKVLQVLEDELKSDRAPSKVLPFNDFGLVIMTRKRVKQSLERTLCIPDPVTEGTGMIKSPITVSNEIFIEMRRMHRHIEKGDILLRVHPEVVKQLKSNGGKRLQELEEMTHKTILVKSDPALNPEQFDIH